MIRPRIPRESRRMSGQDLQPPPTTITLGAIVIPSVCISDGKGRGNRKGSKQADEVREDLSQCGGEKLEC